VKNGILKNLTFACLSCLLVLGLIILVGIAGCGGGGDNGDKGTEIRNIWYRDADGDTYGAPNDSIEAQSQPSGYAADSSDCDDTNARIHPGAIELCRDGKDNDCDGNGDCADPDCSQDPACQTCTDNDGDGYGKPASSSCAHTEFDCNDNDAAIRPGATEICTDGQDNDCDQYTDCADSDCSQDPACQTCTDNDGDGYGKPASPTCAHTELDCNDNDASIHPGANEICTDGQDNDCDQYTDCADSDCSQDPACQSCTDNDGDGYGNPASSTCAHPELDCNDNDPNIHPGATETCDNGIDENCDDTDPACPDCAEETIAQRCYCGDNIYENGYCCDGSWQETECGSAENGYFVAKDNPGGCNDSWPGTEDQPWCTIQHAADTLNEGETVYIKEGTYNEKISLHRSGSEGKYITFQNYGDDEVIVDGTGVGGDEWDGVITSIGNSYIIIQGLHVTLGASGITFDDANYCEIRNNITSYTTRGPGILVGGDSTNFKIDNNEVHHCDTTPGNLEAIRVMELSRDFEVTNNHVHHNAYIGIDIVARKREGVPTRGLIKGNIVHDNGLVYPDSIGIYLDGPNQITVEDNIVYNDSAHGIVLYTEDPALIAHDNIIRGNIMYGNHHDNMVIGTWTSDNVGPVDSNTIENNTMYNAGGYALSIRYADHNVFKNNIFYSDTGGLLSIDPIAGNDNILDYNCWHTGTGYPGIHNVYDDPLMIDPENGDFTPSANSPVCTSSDTGTYMGALPCP
jgi:parallel beta-helix repeat protein